MSRDLDQKLVASFADLGEAKLAGSILEDLGIPYRMADLAQLPRGVFGESGTLGRSAGIWVLEADHDRAAAALAELRSSEAAVDESALAAEALAARPAPGVRAAGPESEGTVERVGPRPRSALAQIIVWALVAAMAVGLLGRVLW